SWRGTGTRFGAGADEAGASAARAGSGASAAGVPDDGAGSGDGGAGAPDDGAGSPLASNGRIGCRALSLGFMEETDHSSSAVPDARRGAFAARTARRASGAPPPPTYNTRRALRRGDRVAVLAAPLRDEAGAGQRA